MPNSFSMVLSRLSLLMVTAYTAVDVQNVMFQSDKSHVQSIYGTGSPGQWVIILTRCETQVFPVFEKNAQNAKRTFEMLK